MSFLEKCWAFIQENERNLVEDAGALINGWSLDYSIYMYDGKAKQKPKCYTDEVVQQEHLCWGDWTGMANTSSARCKGNFNTAWVILTASICLHQIISYVSSPPLSNRIFIWYIWWGNGQTRDSNASITGGKCLTLLLNTKANRNSFQTQGSQPILWDRVTDSTLARWLLCPFQLDPNSIRRRTLQFKFCL